MEARYCRGVGRRWDDFLSTPEGKVAQYRRRKQQRVSIILDEIEPQSKKMRDPEKDNFQRRVIEALDDVRRGAFRGPLALSVDLNTTKPTAPQAHTIAKNLLDLLGTRRPEVKSSRKELLYKDDSQVHALAVSCRHGQDRPSIWISARSFGNVLKDLEVAADALPELEEDLEHCYQNDQEDDSIDYFKTLIAEEAFYRRRLGDSLYQALVKMVRHLAQEAILKRARVTTAQLAWLYDLSKNEFTRSVARGWDEIFCRTPLRVQLSELPRVPGASVSES